MRAAAPAYVPMRRRGMNASVAEYVPSWLRRTVRSSARVVSNGINSLLREINTRRRRSLGERRSRGSRRSENGINSLLREINTRRRRSLGERRRSR